MSEQQNIEYKEHLAGKIISLVEQARSGIVRAANSAMVCTNCLIGKLIVEEYQQGETRIKSKK